MIVELIDKLLDKIFAIYKFKKDSDEKLFLNFIEPVYSDLEKIHNEYLESFREYRHIIKESEKSITEIIDEIKEDYLFSIGARDKLHKLSKIEKDKIVGKFIFHIHHYLTNTDYSRCVLSVVEISRQRWYLTLIGELEKFENKDKLTEFSEELIMRLDTLVIQMQSDYCKITDEYLELRTKLMN